MHTYLGDYKSPALFLWVSPTPPLHLGLILFILLQINLQRFRYR